MPVRNRILTWLLLPLLACPVTALANPAYSLTFLPQDFYASAINNAGQIVGTAAGGAAIWTDTSTTYLSSILPGSEGLAINSQGDIAGRFGIHGFAYSGGVVRDIDTGPFRSWASGINDAGRVTGTVRNIEPFVPASAFVHVDGALTTILTFGTYIDFGNAINNAGQITGFASMQSGDFGNPDRNAFLYDFFGDVTNLGSLGGAVSEGNDLNDAAQVVGWSATSLADEERPFLYTDGAMIDLGSLGGLSGRAHGINNAGMVVGMSDVGGGTAFDYHGFLYANGQMVDLNTLIDPAAGWRVVSATDINDAQQILGKACLGASSDCRSVRLDLLAPIPEPGAWLMLLAGLAVFAGRTGYARRRLSQLLILPVLAAPLVALADPIFTVTFLPQDFSAAAINNAGHIVGGNANGAAIWTPAGVTDIGGIAPGSFGRAINNRGDIGGVWEADAFIHTSGSLRNIGRLGIWNVSQTAAMNDVGQVAGFASDAFGVAQRGFVYTDGVIRTIPTFGGDFSFTTAINNPGQAVGTASFEDPEFFIPKRHAFMYQDRVMQDLGTLGGLISEAYDINNAGQVVGMSEVTPDFKSGEPHPFLYENGSMTDLGRLGGLRASARGLNNLGLIVGESEFSNDLPFDIHAFLYVNGSMVDLNDLIDPVTGWRLVSATDINDANQILGLACGDAGCASVRLDLISAIPEPQVWAMMVAGLVLVGSRRRREPWSSTSV
ncbi:MAG: PEP-CTERM sorting domain-containing protein [Telluria sp.]